MDNRKLDALKLRALDALIAGKVFGLADIKEWPAYHSPEDGEPYFWFPELGEESREQHYVERIQPDPGRTT